MMLTYRQQLLGIECERILLVVPKDLGFKNVY